MMGVWLRALVVVATGLMLSSCGTRPKTLPDVRQIYEIGGAVVTANAGIPKELLLGVQSRMDMAIAATVRPVPMPRAILALHVVCISREPGVDGLRTETEISAMLTDVISGHPLEVKSFLVMSFSLDRTSADISAAEAIAARLRYEYSLNQPALRNSAIDRAALATRMNGQPPAQTFAPSELDTRPIVIPLRNAPVVGVDQDPMLNSKTNAAPELAPASVPQVGIAPDAKPVQPMAPATPVATGQPVAAPLAPAQPAAAAAQPLQQTNVPAPTPAPDQAPAAPANNVEDGAKIKVVIMPKPAATAATVPSVQPVTAPAAKLGAPSEPCVETLQKSC
jgi:hypothetical protein